jgi:uncharacterized protein (DUF305 family)
MTDLTERETEPDAPRRLASSVLPATRAQRMVLVVALLFLAGATGFFLGRRESGPPGKESVDAGFLFDMITHHEQALVLSNLELVNGAESNIQVFAREILTFQSYEVGLMEEKLAQWSYGRTDRPTRAMAWMHMPFAVDAMPGMASAAELDALSDARGRDADALFALLMEDHHRGGLHMASYAADHAETVFVRRIAELMARSQRIEINELEAARRRAGLPERPPGYAPEEAIPEAHGDHRA